MQAPQQWTPSHGAATGAPSTPSNPPSDDVRSLWIGDLLHWMDENYLRACFAPSMTVLSTKVIKNKQTGHSEGYGFIEFESHAVAERALQNFHGTPMPKTDQPFRLNWACFGMGDKRDNDHSIFVGDLAGDVNDAKLLETFKSRYPSVKSAKVVTDSNTGRSKGYGFVRFGEDSERQQAMTEMNGVYCSSRPMRISTATPKRPPPAPPIIPKVAVPFPALHFPFPSPVIDDAFSNTTIFVGGLDQNASDEDLRKVFSKFGEITYTKIPPGRGCGFVQFTTRSSAEEALQKLQGSVIGQQTVRLSWGRTPSSKQRLIAAPGGPWCQPQFDPAQWNGYYAGYGGFDGYGYVFPHDPAFAYAGYQGHGTYPQQVN